MTIVDFEEIRCAVRKRNPEVYLSENHWRLETVIEQKPYTLVRVEIRPITFRQLIDDVNYFLNNPFTDYVKIEDKNGIELAKFVQPLLFHPEFLKIRDCGHYALDFKDVYNLKRGVFKKLPFWINSWCQRCRMESQKVWTIGENHFKWFNGELYCLEVEMQKGVNFRLLPQRRESDRGAFPPSTINFWLDE